MKYNKIGSTEIELRQNEVEVNELHTSRVFWGALLHGIVQFIRDVTDTVLSFGSKSIIIKANSNETNSNNVSCSLLRLNSGIFISFKHANGVVGTAGLTVVQAVGQELEKEQDRKLEQN